MKSAPRIELTDSQRTLLTRWSRGRSTPVRLMQRAKIVLLAAEGKMNKAIAAELGIMPNTVGRWRARFAGGGPAAIAKDAPRSGRTPLKRNALAQRIIEKTTQEKPQNATHWSGRTLAAALGAEACEICTDVDGVFSADPARVPGARLWSEISYEEAIEMSSSGAKVLHPRAAEICMEYDVPIHVRSSFHLRDGTWIRGGESIMERAEVVGVTSDSKIAKVTLLDVADEPGIAARVFEDLARAGINIRLIIQSASSEHQARITFIPELESLDGARELVRRWEAEGVARRGVIESDVAKISIVGSRLASTPGLAARMFAALAREGINIDCISSSEMKVACVISGDRLDDATRVVHREFFPEDEGAAATPSGPR